jgi:hypothetical protein
MPETSELPEFHRWMTPDECEGWAQRSNAASDACRKMLIGQYSSLLGARFFAPELGLVSVAARIGPPACEICRPLENLIENGE